jgi:hypothetical protein
VSPSEEPQTNSPAVSKRTSSWVPSGCLALLAVMILAILAPVFRSARVAAKRSTNLLHLKALDQACLMYDNDFGDRYPRSDRWMNSIAVYIPDRDSFQNPMGNDGEFGYAMNSDLSAKLDGEVEDPAATILLYESRRSDRNLSRPAILIPGDVPPGREGASIGVGFADGHSKFLTPAGLVETVRPKAQSKR